MPSPRVESSLLPRAFATAALLALAACADDPAGKASSAAQAASAPQVAQQTCHREFPVGSNIPVTRCAPADSGRTVQQMRDDLPKAGATPATAAQMGQWDKFGG